MEIPVVDANRIDPDQTPRFAASDLGLHSLPKTILWNAGHKWVKIVINLATHCAYKFQKERFTRTQISTLRKHAYSNI